MKKAQLIVLTGAIVAAAGAGYLTMGLANKEPETRIVESQKPAIEYEKVLVASTNVSMGTNLTEDMITWQNWPAESVPNGFITQSAQPDAMSEVSGSITRSPIYNGEPIRNNKLVRAEEGFMSAILPKGQRAVATSISTATSAGGFILPNDRVDVIMTRRRTGEGEEGYSTEVVLENVRVLAIDQTIQEQDGEAVVVGETATLQLTPKQVEVLSVAQQMAERLSLALRSIADSGENDGNANESILAGGTGTVRVIRYGTVRETTASPSKASETE